MDGATTVAPRRLPAKAFMTEAQLADVRTRNPWRGIGMIVHAWAVIGAAMTLAIIWPNPLTIIFAIMLIGSRQLGLAILMHEGAHGLIVADEKSNLAISQWLSAYPIFAETRAYRRYHLQHHAHTQTEDDPDLVLSAPFPITSASYRRKLWRDISGQTGYEQRKAQVMNALGDRSRPVGEQLSGLWRVLGGAITFNAALAVVMTGIGAWWAYPVLWLVPLLTWFQVVTRIRNIAEHAVVGDSNDPLRNTRTTLANRIERLFVAPYYVNYHLEHHLLFYVPAYNLPRVHEILRAGPLGGRIELERGYAAVLRKALAKPVALDQAEDVASRARRAAAGGKSESDRMRGGF